ncbi:MAG: hypothetical protein L0387_28730 [Acidobacteria bacterium]|nr:hypothetical protein [Acidobacteriota bacterium]MCI0722519.1 hypothetical protein [Acidobacteriota bacterium]
MKVGHQLGLAYTRFSMLLRQLFRESQPAVAGRDRSADHDRKIAALVDAQIKSDYEERIAKVAKAQEQTDEALKRLAEAQQPHEEAQARTDERLNALRDIVDRWIRERRNGASAS